MTRLPLEVREAAALFGRMGGKAAGRKMSKEARIARAKKAARARWEKRKKRSKSPLYSAGLDPGRRRIMKRARVKA